MEKEFVPYKLALRLKKLGFDEPCFGFYKLDDVDVYYDTILQGKNHKFRNNDELNIHGDLKEKISAPTFSQAFRWFRDNYGLLHELISCAENSWLITVVDMNSKSVNGVYMKRINLDDRDENIPETYEEAELACLDKLIEIVDRKSE